MKEYVQKLNVSDFEGSKSDDSKRVVQLLKEHYLIIVYTPLVRAQTLETLA